MTSRRPVSAYAHQTPQQYPIPGRTSPLPYTTRRSPSPTRHTRQISNRPSTAGNAALAAAAVVYGAIPRGGGINPDQLSERSMASSMAHNLLPNHHRPSHTRASTQFHGWMNEDARLPQLDAAGNHARSQSGPRLNVVNAMSAGVPSSFLTQTPNSFPFPPPAPTGGNNTPPVAKRKQRPAASLVPQDTATHYAPPSIANSVRLNQTADTRRVALANWLHVFDGQREKMHRSIDVRPYLYAGKQQSGQSSPPEPQSFNFDEHQPQVHATLSPYGPIPSASSSRPNTAAAPSQYVRPRPPSSNSRGGGPGTGRSQSTNRVRPQTSPRAQADHGHHPSQQVPHGFFVVPAANAKEESKVEGSPLPRFYAGHGFDPYSSNRPLVEEFAPRSAALDFARTHPLLTLSHIPGTPNPAVPGAGVAATPAPGAPPPSVPTVSPVDRNLLLSYFMTQSSLFRDTTNVRIENRELDELVIRGHIVGQPTLSAFGAIEILELLDSVSYRCASVNELLCGVTLLRSLANGRSIGGRRRGFNVAEWMQLKKALILFLSSPLCHFRDGLFDQLPVDPLKVLEPQVSSLKQAVMKKLQSISPVDLSWPTRSFTPEELEQFDALPKYDLPQTAKEAAIRSRSVSPRPPSVASVPPPWYTPDGLLGRPLGGSAGSSIHPSGSQNAYTTFEAGRRKVVTVQEDSTGNKRRDEEKEPSPSRPVSSVGMHTSGDGAMDASSSLAVVSNFTDFALIPPVVLSAVDRLFDSRLVGSETLQIFHFLHDSRTVCKSFDELEGILAFSRDFYDHLLATGQDEILHDHPWMNCIRGSSFTDREWLFIPGSVNPAQRHSFHPSGEGVRRGAVELQDWIQGRPGSNAIQPQLPKAKSKNDRTSPSLMDDTEYLLPGGSTTRSGLTDQVRFEQRQKIHAFFSSANCVLFHHITAPISIADADLNHMLDAFEPNETDEPLPWTLFDFLNACNTLPRYFKTTHELLLAVEAQPARLRVSEEQRLHLWSFLVNEGILDHMVSESSNPADDSSAPMHVSGEYLNLIWSLGSYSWDAVEHMLLNLRADGFQPTTMLQLTTELSQRRAREKRVQQFRQNLASHIPPKPTAAELSQRVAQELAKRPQAPLFQISQGSAPHDRPISNKPSPSFVPSPSVAGATISADRANTPYQSILDAPRGVGASSISPRKSPMDGAPAADFLRDYALSHLVAQATKANEEEQIELTYREKLLHDQATRQAQEERARATPDPASATFYAAPAARVTPTKGADGSTSSSPMPPSETIEHETEELTGSVAPTPVPVLGHVAHRIYGDAASDILKTQQHVSLPNSPVVQAPPRVLPPPTSGRKVQPAPKPSVLFAPVDERMFPTPPPQVARDASLVQRPTPPTLNTQTQPTSPPPVQRAPSKVAAPKPPTPKSVKAVEKTSDDTKAEDPTLIATTAVEPTVAPSVVSVESSPLVVESQPEASIEPVVTEAEPEVIVPVQLNQPSVVDNVEPAAASIVDRSSEEQAAAAIKLQSLARGRKARSEVASIKVAKRQKLLQEEQQRQQQQQQREAEELQRQQQQLEEQRQRELREQAAKAQQEQLERDHEKRREQQQQQDQEKQEQLKRDQEQREQQQQAEQSATVSIDSPPTAVVVVDSSESSAPEVVDTEAEVPIRPPTPIFIPESKHAEPIPTFPIDAQPTLVKAETMTLTADTATPLALSSTAQPPVLHKAETLQMANEAATPLSMSASGVTTPQSQPPVLHKADTLQLANEPATPLAITKKPELTKDDSVNLSISNPATQVAVKWRPGLEKADTMTLALEAASPRTHFIGASSGAVDSPTSAAGSEPPTPMNQTHQAPKHPRPSKFATSKHAPASTTVESPRPLATIILQKAPSVVSTPATTTDPTETATQVDTSRPPVPEVKTIESEPVAESPPSPSKVIIVSKSSATPVHRLDSVTEERAPTPTLEASTESQPDTIVESSKPVEPVNPVQEIKTENETVTPVTIASAAVHAEPETVKTTEPAPPAQPEVVQPVPVVTESEPVKVAAPVQIEHEFKIEPVEDMESFEVNEDGDKTPIEHEKTNETKPTASLDTIPAVDPPPKEPLCQVCYQATATSYCADCNMSLCALNGCDGVLHSSTNLSAHSRVPIAQKAEAIHEWKFRGFPTNIPPAPTGPLCQVCSGASAQLWCYDCEMDLCSADGSCDQTLHSPPTMSSHTRVPIVHKNEPRPLTKKRSVVLAPAKAPSPTTSPLVTPAVAPVRPTSAKLVLGARAPVSVDPPKTVIVTSAPSSSAAPSLSAEVSKVKSILTESTDLWKSHVPTLKDKDIITTLQVCANRVTFIEEQVPRLIAAKRQFLSMDELTAWITTSVQSSSGGHPIVCHAGNNLLLQPLKTLLDNPACRILKSAPARQQLYTSTKLDELVTAGDGVDELHEALSRLHSLHHGFQSVDDLIASVQQFTSMGFFLPRPLLSRIVDYVKKKPPGTSGQSQLFAPVGYEVPEMDAELLDSLVSKLGRSLDESGRFEESLDSKLDVCIEYLKRFDDEKRQFDSWEGLCSAMLEVQAADLKAKATKPTPATQVAVSTSSPAPSAAKNPAPATIVAKAPAAATPPTATASAASASSILSASQKQSLMECLGDESFAVFDDVEDDLSITQTGLENLVLAAGAHGADGLIHILTGLNGIGRRARSFDHLIEIVSEVVEDGAYSSRAARGAIIDYLCDASECRLFVVGASSSISAHTVDFLRSTPPSKLDQLILALGGSSAVPTIMEHLSSLSRVGNRFEDFEDILAALTHALDPQQGGGSFVGAKDWKELVSFLSKNKSGSHLLPPSIQSRSSIEDGLRSCVYELDHLFSLATDTIQILKSASDKPLGMFASAVSREDDDDTNDLPTPETGVELITSQMEQMNSQSNKSPLFQDVPALIRDVTEKIDGLKAAKQAEEARKLEMLKRLNRASQ